MFQISSQQCIDPDKAIVEKIRQDAIDAYRRELSVTDCEVLLAQKRADTHLSTVRTVEPAGFDELIVTTEPDAIVAEEAGAMPEAISKAEKARKDVMLTVIEGMSRVLNSLKRDDVPNVPFFRCRLQNYIHLPDIVTDVDEAVRQLAHIGGTDRSLRAFKHGSILYAAGRLSIPTIKRKYDLQYPDNPLPSEPNLRNSKVYYEFCFNKHPLFLFFNVSPWDFQRLGQEWLDDTFTDGPLGRFFNENRGFFRQELDRFLSGLPSEPNGVVFDDTLDILEEMKADLRKSTGATESRKRKRAN